MKIKPNMVRILPMDKRHEFKGKGIEEVQEDFFLRDLPREKDRFGIGKFRYKQLGMNAEAGTIVLFQYDNKIVASAELSFIKKYDKPQIGNEYNKKLTEKKYNGAYYFEPTSILVFDPISGIQVQQIWAEGFTDNNRKYHKAFERFNRVRQFLNPIRYREFYKILNNIRRP